MPEFQVPGPGLDEEAGGQRFRERLRGGCADVLDIEALPHHGRPFERIARVERECLGAQQDRVEHRLGQRQAAGLRAAAIERECRGELLDGERDALRPLVESA